MKLSGYGRTTGYPYLRSYSSNGGWTNYTQYFRLPPAPDIFNETTTRKYIPPDGANGTLTIYMWTSEVRGHNSDDEHPRNILCDAKTVKIYIKNPLPTESQVIGH